ncbi:MAG TPA: hypothetical protein VGZ22_31205 [Isosphaeraceae bacterium]|jgi:hypothetical protein|nr:hypothetical protein [Isosphaeraceae bacterium]
MIRKTWWLAVGLAAVLGCDKPGDEPNNSIPPSPPGTKHNSTASGSPSDMPAPQAPSGYPSGIQNKAAPTDSTKPEDAPKADAPKTDDAPAPKADDKADAPKAENVSLSEEELAQIKKLPEADQALALKQKVCLVEGGHLGEMGVPVKVTFEGQTFFLCCKGCNEEAKLKVAVAKLKKN